MPSQKVASAYVDLQLQTAAFKAAIGEASNEMRKFSAEMREESAKSKESVKLLSEELGLGIPRGLQGIISKLPGMTTAMNAAFSGVVVFALAKTVYEVGEKVVEFAKKSEEAAKKNAEAWKGVNQPLQQSNDELRLANDRLENSIAKLEHKPQNGLKEAIDEAIVSADKLSSKLDADLSKLDDVLKKNATSVFGEQLFKGAASTQDIQDKFESLDERIKDANREGNASIRAARDSKDPNALKRAQQELDDTLSALYSEGAKFAQSVIDNAKLAQRAQANPNAYPMSYRTGFNSQNMDARISSASGLLDFFNSQRDSLDLNKQNASLTNTNDMLKAGQAAAEAQKQAVKMFVDESIAEYKDLQEQSDRITEEITATWLEGQKRDEEAAKKAAEVSAQAAKEYWDAFKRGEEEQRESADKLAQTLLKIAVANGRLTPHQAAMREASDHLSEYNKQMEHYADLLATIKGQESSGFITSEQAGAQREGVSVDQQKTQSDYQIQQLTDNALVFQTSFAGSVQDTFTDIIAKSENFGSQFKETITGALNSVNDAIIHILTTKPQAGEHPFKDAGKEIFTGVARTGLQDAEGSIMKAFGLGKMGTRSNPMFVQFATPHTTPSVGSAVSTATSAAESATGGGFFNSLFKGLFSAVIPMAGGGLMSPGDWYLTGEKGPELLQVGSTSKINNARDTSAMFSGGGSSTTHNWSIDARGSSDPAATRAAVMNGIKQAAPYLVAGGNAAQRDKSRRVPSMRGA